MPKLRPYREAPVERPERCAGDWIADAEGRITQESGQAVSDARARLRAMEAEW
ncbi:hypothetical protein [Streptomyces gardneri]|uniref:hypothetical protein n=1 Tax=Streptomyces gardneri TaxID=66892 RepID=UPI0035DF3902